MMKMALLSLGESHVIHSQDWGQAQDFGGRLEKVVAIRTGRPAAKEHMAPKPMCSGSPLRRCGASDFD